MPRDSQKQRVYDAECDQPHGERFETVQECQAYVDRVLQRKRLRLKFTGKNPHRMTIEVRDGRGRSSANASTDWGVKIIKLPRWARTELTILHEMAHHLSPGRGHDWHFCHTLLILVREMLGKEAEGALKAAYRTRGVRFSAPRTRQMTPEAAEAARERLAAARAAREVHRGRWVIQLTNNQGDAYWLHRLSYKFNRADYGITRQSDEAQEWAFRTTAEKWCERLTNQGKKVEAINLGA